MLAINSHTPIGGNAIREKEKFYLLWPFIFRITSTSIIQSPSLVIKVSYYSFLIIQEALKYGWVYTYFMLESDIHIYSLF